MPHSLHIGEVATRTGRSVHAIRWYEAQGLVPGVERDGGGRRVYTEHHVGWLEFMDRLRGTGMSVAQMRAYTALVKKGSAALGERRALLRAHQARVLENIARWTEALTLIEAKLEFYDEWVAKGARPAVGPHRRVWRAAQRHRKGPQRAR
ncbi:MAG TPA: MerR family transcriptional regulator [Reyranella sp.]|jgi:DNA-binding transcriptional MerR regulator|nr:MerR family transcriptional regulator [Reyranella sp.]HSS82364.1 MerR family transcriptional regulator [Reyranella sp.]